ncbi:hypothetical protein DAPPUDRAFT_323849 [Daphnia pulex]|uniref:Uncharacterized protein n=1 Tax=Daphnia pulex TaxID=6669 RepID=E9GZY1_DAPPU|nr:hypothetical protein DAPPUDRAFT_323849 [Daphnia pulex]|eukprot:EFX74898.1 hypothetical protein DAPPUDRAFT_323849 [Daphnia pulex]
MERRPQTLPEYIQLNLMLRHPQLLRQRCPTSLTIVRKVASPGAIAGKYEENDSEISVDESHHLSVDEFFSAGENLFEMSIATLTQTTTMQLLKISILKPQQVKIFESTKMSKRDCMAVMPTGEIRLVFSSQLLGYNNTFGSVESDEN